MQKVQAGTAKIVVTSNGDIVSVELEKNNEEGIQTLVVDVNIKEILESENSGRGIPLGDLLKNLTTMTLVNDFSQIFEALMALNFKDIKTELHEKRNS